MNLWRKIFERDFFSTDLQEKRSKGEREMLLCLEPLPLSSVALRSSVECSKERVLPVEIVVEEE